MVLRHRADGLSGCAVGVRGSFAGKIFAGDRNKFGTGAACGRGAIRALAFGRRVARTFAAGAALGVGDGSEFLDQRFDSPVGKRSFGANIFVRPS